MKNKSILLISLFLLLLIAIPSCFAMDSASSVDDSNYLSAELKVNDLNSYLSNENAYENAISDEIANENSEDMDDEGESSDFENYGMNGINLENPNEEIESTDEDILLETNEYYFDASLENDDGNGSIENPYKYLTSSRIKANSTIHLANGEYALNKRVNINNVNIMGTDALNTIIRYNGFAFNITSSLSISGVTLSGITIENNGQLTATDAIFKNGKGRTVDYYGNNFGGAIYCPYSDSCTSVVNLNNCTFINNTAEYGGAIYMDNGYLTIANSHFINNTAYNYGGAIALEYNIRALINTTEFIGDKSTNDAGGAIYLRCSPISASDLKFESCEATFGAGLASLNSTVNLELINGENNIAKYHGGAIYHMYGSFSLKDSSFTNNSASSGGALFIDNSTSFYLINSQFINNSASISAGAVYSILNNLKSGESIRDNVNGNTFSGNEAPSYDDEYETTKLNIVIGNGNYTMYKFNDTDIGELPDYYSLIDLNQVTSVKDQQTSGNCWAFTAMATLESCILKASGDNLNFSEENMKNLMAFYSGYGWDTDTNDGGYDEMPIGYLVSWLGPVFEDADLTDDKSTLSAVLNSVVHVQNVIFLRRSNFTDNDEIKEALMKYGAVGTGIYYDDAYLKGNSYYCYNGFFYGNHAITIVGWNDTYSRNNFIKPPEGDGAWIVKNSWNSDWGDNGYFYVSYYDPIVARIGNPAAYTFILNDTVRFDKNYQYDIGGTTDYFYNSSSTVWYKNVFTSTDNEILAGVSTYFEKLTNWTVSINVNGISKLNQTGNSKAGYYTINLDQFIPLTAGDEFEVIFKITTTGAAGFPISEIGYLNQKTYMENASFVSYDGITWQDLYDLEWSYGHIYSSQVACIKAFTITGGIGTNTNIEVIYSNYNPVTIKAHVMDQYGRLVNSGKVSFILNGREVVVDVKEGLAQLTYNFEKLENTIEAIFNGIGYMSSTDSTTVEISRMDVGIALEVITNLNTAKIKINASENINATVKVLVNDYEYVVDLIDGKGELDLEELDKDSFNVKAFFENEEIFNSEEQTGNFIISVITTKINSSDFITDDYSGELYEISLVNKTGDAIADKEIAFTINNQTFNSITDNEGKARIPINLAGGEYTIFIDFNGDEDYVPSHINASIKVKDKVKINIEFNQNINDLEILITLDKQINETLNISFNGETYSMKTIDGEVKLEFANLSNGNYTASAELLNDLDYIANISVNEIEIDVNELNIIAEAMNTTDYSNDEYSIYLTDKSNNPVSNKTVRFILNGNSFQTQSDNEGKASMPIYLAGGDYEIRVEFDGDNQFFKSSNKSNIKVKDKVNIAFTITQNSNNIQIDISLSKPIDERISLLLKNLNTDNSTEYLINSSNGSATLSLDNLENAKYDISINLLENDQYVSNGTNSEFTINIIKSKIIAKDRVIGDYSNRDYLICLLDENNNPIANKKISIELNGETYSKFTNSLGEVSIPIYLAIGTYNITASFSGDDEYGKSNGSSTIYVIETVNCTISIETLLDDASIELGFSKDLNETISINVFSKDKLVNLTKDINIINGRGTLNLDDLDEGNYIIVIDMEAYDISINKTFNIDKTMTIISNDFTTFFKSNSAYTIRLMNNGKAVANKTIVFTLNNQKFTKTTDNKGQASININLETGTYQLSIFNSETKDGKTQKIKVIAPITGNKNLVKYFGNKKAFKVRILGDGGKPVGAGKIVSMKVNGKTYNVKTDKNGYASLNLNLKPNTYTIATSFNGYSLKNKVTIKSTIITKNISKKRKKFVKFTAKLVNSNGKILKNKKITFKFKGKTKKIKTNKKGIATFSLGRLKVGKYSISSKYGKLTVKNTITIKK